MAAFLEHGFAETRAAAGPITRLDFTKDNGYGLAFTTISGAIVA